jgi:hypothetical protein
MARLLTKLRIDEISLVDRGAGDKCHVVLAKRDDSGEQGLQLVTRKDRDRGDAWAQYRREHARARDRKRADAVGRDGELAEMLRDNVRTLADATALLLNSKSSAGRALNGILSGRLEDRADAVLRIADTLRGEAEQRKRMHVLGMSPLSEACGAAIMDYLGWPTMYPAGDQHEQLNDEADDAAPIVDEDGDVLEPEGEDTSKMKAAEVAVLKKAASTPAGLHNICKHISDDERACGLSRADFDSLVIAHCEVNNKNLNR